jgi:hypothetical protein
MFDLITAATVIYWCVDFWTLTKYFDQIKAIRRSKRVIGSARKYFLKAIVRELAFLPYCAFALNYNLVLGSLSILALLLNLIILCLMIMYKRVNGKRNWEDNCYDWVKYNILWRLK